VPLLNELAPDGFFYGGHYIVEFDPDSLWYETSLTIASMALKQGMKTEYHCFQHPPSEAIEAFAKLGIDAEKLKKEGLLNIWDSFTGTMNYETEKKQKLGKELITWKSTHDQPFDMVKTYEYLKKQAKAGWSKQEKRWLHLDDNTAIMLQYNPEREYVEMWRTAGLPVAIRARETPHFLAFVKGVASEPFYTRYEALCDGIIDVKAQEEGGRIENYLRVRMLRGKTFDSKWHRLQLGRNGEVRLVDKLRKITARPEFKKPETRLAFDFLVSSFIDDYMRKRLHTEQSGWKSLVQIGDACKIPQGRLYGRQGRYGPLVEELIGRGLVETRTFAGHRGRGGEAMLVRIAYDRSPVKKYVDKVALNV